MGFSMRMTFADVIKKASFKDLLINGQKNGFEFDVQLGYYRGHYLSDIDKLEVSIDGNIVPQEAVSFRINGKELPIYQVKEAYTEFWQQVTPATISVLLPGGLTVGEHTLKFDLILRIPYMAIGPNHMYMPLDSGDEVKITSLPVVS